MSAHQLNIQDLRQDYRSSQLNEGDIFENPFQQFEKWFKEALNAKVLEPNAMTLATATKEGKPSARIVLLKEFDDKGFVFYTNYNSHKGSQLAENPYAALLFFWGDLERQVRIEGKIEKVSVEESAAYFCSRPVGSRLGAWASPQSEVIPDRAFLENNLSELTQKFQEQDIPLPGHWGGYRLIPENFEFWQGRSNRLHDRIFYSLEDHQWKTERLAP